MATVNEELHELVDHLSPSKQRRLLEFAKLLMLSEADTHSAFLPKSTLPPGQPGSILASKHFNISSEDIEAMESALED